MTVKGFDFFVDEDEQQDSHGKGKEALSLLTTVAIMLY